MEEIIRGILFLFFGSIAIILFSITIKTYKCPHWKYNEARKKKISGLAINMKTNRWIGNEIISEESVAEILR